MLPAVPRIVAIGDLHGDMDKTRRAFRVAGLIDQHDRWAGGTTTAVQALLEQCSAAIPPFHCACFQDGKGDSTSRRLSTLTRVAMDRQVGDQLDRGDDELPVLYFLERLAREAQVGHLRAWYPLVQQMSCGMASHGSSAAQLSKSGAHACQRQSGT